MNRRATPNSHRSDPARSGPEPVVAEYAPWLARLQPHGRSTSTTRGRLLKRTTDVVLVTLALPVLLPLMLACALGLKLESPRDPIFFVQLRTGLGGRRFRILKFRTMVADAEARKAQVAHLNVLTWPDFKVADDPRVTRVGRILRRTSLDELPQVFNVLRGDMSLVGPRPTSFPPETYEEWQKHRLAVPPGITGVWQITGRGALEFDERVRLDLAYIERQSLSLDLRILLRTCAAVFSKNAIH